MATFDLTDPKVMTVKKGGTTQVLSFSDALKNSSTAAEWREHEVRFAKTIEAIAQISSKFEELKSKGKDYEPSIYELGSLHQEYSKSIEGINNECNSCIHQLKDNYQSERRKVLSCQTSGLEQLYKECSTMFSKLKGCETVHPNLKDKGQFLRYCKLSDQFNDARVKIQNEIVKTDSLIAQGARSTNVKSALPKVREMKDEMDKALKEQRTLLNLNFGNREFFAPKEAILAEVERELQKATIEWIGYEDPDSKDTNTALENLAADATIAEERSETHNLSTYPETDQGKRKKSAVERMDQSLELLKTFNDTISRDESSKYEEGSTKYEAPADKSQELKPSTSTFPSTIKSAASEPSKYQHSNTGSRSSRLSERRRLESRAKLLEQESRKAIQKKERELELKRKQRQLEMKLKDAYSYTIKTDKDSGYIRILEPAELQNTRNDPQWYLPHHPEINPNKPGKVRRVCNAASEFEGQSLNKSLFNGPNLLQNLVGIIFRFREKPFDMSADIEAIFLQVQVPPEDAKCLRFVWRENQSDEISTYEYTRHIFGAKDSPTCANYAPQRTAMDNEEEFPIASRIVKRNFYMDDFLYSAEKIQDAKSLKQNLISLLQKGGFKLSKGQSNVKEMCEKDSDVESVTALGLEWKLISDDLKICRGFAGKEHTIITHRVVLSVASSIFAPLGLASPFTIRNRPILRHIWQKALKSWDEENPQDVAQQYLYSDWLQEIPGLKELSINRHYGWHPGSNVQLHVFADASEMGLCVVAYLRFEVDDEVKVSFVMGKTRVAPIKTTTIPKLELQAALHASRIKVSIIEEHDFTINQVFMWSDSSTVI